MRGVAILGVVIVHCVGLTAPHLGPINSIGLLGQRGVQLFYLVSALTLFMSWHQERRVEAHPLLNFFTRRFCRIAPAYYLAIFASILCYGVRPNRDGISVGGWDVAENFFLVHGLNPRATLGVVAGGWSVAVEAMFYFALPLLLAAITSLRRALVLLCLALPACGLLATALHARVGPDELFYIKYSFPIQFPVFCAGIVLFFLLRTPVAHRLHGSRRLALALLGLSALLFALAVPIDDTSALSFYLSSAPMVPLLLSAAVYPLRLLVNRVTVFLGRISYSIYLVHLFVVAAVSPLVVPLVDYGPQPWPGRLAVLLVAFALVMIPTTLISYLTWRFVEQPGIALGKRLIARRESRAARPLPAATAPADL